jgi:hypothetical protein
MQKQPFFFFNESKNYNGAHTCNYNLHLLLYFSGAMIINGWMKLESEVLQAGLNFTAESEAVIDFKTDVDFAEMPFKMCLQMIRPPLQYRYIFTS